jgi:hypothetical protein
MPAADPKRDLGERPARVVGTGAQVRPESAEIGNEIGNKCRGC